MIVLAVVALGIGLILGMVLRLVPFALLAVALLSGMIFFRGLADALTLFVGLQVGYGIGLLFRGVGARFFAVGSAFLARRTRGQLLLW